MKQCTKCLILKRDWEFGPDKRHRDGLQCQCRKCMNISAIKYQKTEKGKIARKSRDSRYDQSQKGKDDHKRYWKSEKGKKTRVAINAKCHAIRKRKLNWIPLFSNPFNDSIEVDWHHITDAYVVAIPRDLHRMYMGMLHREKVMEIAKQIYL